MLTLRTRATENPNAIAVIAGNRALTFHVLHERCCALIDALNLATPDARNARPLAFVAHNELDTFVLVHALMLAERTALPLHPRLTEPERATLLKLAGACLLERSEVGWSVVQTAPDVPGEREASFSTPSRPPQVWIAANGIAAPPPRPQQVLIATSGSTGAPKLVSLSRDAVRAAAKANATHLAMTPADRWLLSLNLAHIGGYSIVTRCLESAATVVLGPATQDVEALARQVQDEQVTLLSLVPTQLQRLLALESPPRLTSLRALLVGGARCPATLLASAQARGLPVLLTYGMSEACAQITTQPLSSLTTRRAGGPEAANDCGTALGDLELRLRDGVLELRGSSLFDGYVTEPGVALDRRDIDADGWFHTGDLGELTPNGRFVPLGRRRDRIVTGGENVSPLEVEAALLGLPEIRAAAVVGLPDPEWGQRVAAVVVPNGAQVADPPRWLDEIHASLRLRLAPYKCPKSWLCLEELPLLPSGKVDRSAVAQLFVQE